MINIPNHKFIKWLKPVDSNRKTELLYDIGLDQQRKGIPRKTIVKIVKQLYSLPLVKVKPLKKELEKKLLTSNGEFKEENLFINSDINECLRENEYDTDTVEDMCLPVITSVISLRDDDADSIEICLSEEDTRENEEETGEKKGVTCEKIEGTCENKENTEKNLEDKLKDEKNIKSSITQTQVDTPTSTPNEKLHQEVKEKEKGVDNIGKISNNIENHQVEVNNKPIFCTKYTKDKTDPLLYNSFVVEQNKQNQKQIIILKEVLRRRLESKNVSLPTSKNSKSLDTTNDISESIQKLSPPIKKIGVEFSTESKEEYKGINSSEMIECVQMEVGQLEKSTSELSTEGNDRSKNKPNRTNVFYSNSQQHKQNSKMENPCKEFVSHTPNAPTNQRLPNNKRPADQRRGTQQVSKRRRKSATDSIDNHDYSFLSKSSLTAVPIPRRYSLDLNSSMTKQNELKVLTDISFKGKSSTNNTTKGHTVDHMSRDKELTESVSCVCKYVETDIRSAEEIVEPTVIGNGRSYSINNLKKSLHLDNKLTKDFVKHPENQLLAVTRSTATTNKAPAVSTCTAPANQAPAVQKSTDLANQAPVTTNELPAVAICTVPVSRAPSFPTCSNNQASALPTSTVPANQTPAVPICTVRTNEVPPMAIFTVSSNQTVLTSTDPVNHTLAVPTCTATTDQAPAVPTLVSNALTNDQQSCIQRSFAEPLTSIDTAVSLFFDNFESNQIVNHIPPTIRSELLEYLTIKGKNITRITDCDILQLYMRFYIQFFDKDVSTKIKKSAEILHLAIADYNCKKQHLEKAVGLATEASREKEKMLAHKEYSENLNYRGMKFSKIFDSILTHFKHCASTMTVTLYYRITQALVAIDNKNITHTSTIRGLISNLLKSAKSVRDIPSCSFYLFHAQTKDLEATFMFVKTCLVILHALGYCQNGSEDVLKFANLQPTSLKIKNVLHKNFNLHTIETSTTVDYTRQWGRRIANTYGNSNTNPNNEMSTLKNNTNTIFVNSQDSGITSESMRDQRQVHETLKHNTTQLIQQLQNSHKELLNNHQCSTSELNNRQQINITNLKLPHLISNNEMQNRDKFIAKQQPQKNNFLTAPSQHMYDQYIQVTTPNNVLHNISKTHPSQQTHHKQTYSRHNTFTNDNVNQSRPDPQTFGKSQEVEANSQEDTNTASFNIQATTANSQTASSCNSGLGPSPNLKNDLILFNRNMSRRHVCDVAYCSVYANLACSLCKAMFYCSRDCQERDWYSGHMKTCQGSIFPNQD